MLGPSGLEALNGRLLFYVENQGVYLWGSEPEGKDPPVWGRFNGEESWLREEVTLTEFPIQACIPEAILSASNGAAMAWANRETLD